MKITTIALSTLLLVATACSAPGKKEKEVNTQNKEKPIYKGKKTEHIFTDLPYTYDALEPYIDAQTMELHYNKHHKGYFNKFKNAIKGSDLEHASLKFIFENASSLSADIINNAGGYYNHTLFWSIMAPGGQGEPSEALLNDINTSFGSMDAFKQEFNNNATSQFGSGWSWLVVQNDGSLVTCGTPNQNNPLMDIAKVKGVPILALDVWEHAYYLKYQNKRGDYIENFWNLINWNEVNRRYQIAKK